MLPDSIGGMRSLQRLYVNNCGMTSLPGALADLLELEELYAAQNEIESLPPLPPSLNKLHVPHNQLTALPSALPNRLEILHCGNNVIGAITPGLLASLTEIKFIHFNGNQLASFPFADVDMCIEAAQGKPGGGLRVVDLADNPLMELDEARTRMRALAARLEKPWVFAGGGGGGDAGGGVQGDQGRG